MLGGTLPILLAGALMLAGCEDHYSQDPKVAAAYAGAAAAVTIAQAVAEAHADDPPPASGAPDPTTDVRLLRSYAVQAINRIRAERSLAPLTPSPALDEFAQRGSEWLESDHQPRRHLLSDARCTRCGENQGSAQGEIVAPAQVQIDAAFRTMMSADGEPRKNLLSGSWRFVGVGIKNPGNDMYLTIDFAEVAL